LISVETPVVLLCSGGNTLAEKSFVQEALKQPTL